jgi:hypothetical protein
LGLVGPAAGAVAAGVVSWLYLAQRFYRQPFWDWGAVGLWLLLIALDIALLLLTAAGYVAGRGTPSHNLGTVVGWIVAGVTIPLAVRSPVRETTLRGSTRPVGITYAYDWLRAVMEDPLDGRLAESRRSQEKQVARALSDRGWTAVGVLSELEDHLNHLQRRSPSERARVLASAKKASQNLPAPDDLRGIIVAVETARCGSFVAGLDKGTPR